MASRTILFFLSTLACLVNRPSLADDEIAVSSVEGSVEMRDLMNVASELGLHFRAFDYESSDDHCLHFFVDVSTNDSEAQRHDGAGHCGVAGKHRLTISWKLDDGKAQFGFKRFHRDLGQGGGVGGPAISISNAMSSTMYRVDSPFFSMGRETVLLHGAYGPRGRGFTEFKVIVELRPNPDGIIGTE